MRRSAVLMRWPAVLIRGPAVLMRRPAVLIAGLLLVAAAAAGLIRAADRPASLPERVATVAGSLRCPTCAGESVAASRADTAESMRAEVERQLRAGRSPAQVRAWFAQKYGDWVLLDPPTHGVGALLLVLPGLLLLGIPAALVVQHRRRPRAEPASQSPRTRPRYWAAGLTVAVVAFAVVAAVLVPSHLSGSASASHTAAGAGGSDAGTAAARAEQLDGQGRLGDAAMAYRAALLRAPGDPKLSVRLAFVLLRTHQAAQAKALLKPVSRAAPDDPQVLLMLGLAERETADPTAAGTLRRFLRLAPADPAAPRIRTLLGAA